MLGALVIFVPQKIQTSTFFEAPVIEVGIILYASLHVPGDVLPAKFLQLERLPKFLRGDPVEGVVRRAAPAPAYVKAY